MPEAFIWITTSPAPGAGSGKLRSSTLRSPRKTTPRMALGLPDRGALARGAIEGHGRRGAAAFPLLLVDHLAEEIELDRHVVRVLEEDLEQLRVGEAAEMHLDLVALDAVAHFLRVLGQERDVVDRARAGGALGVLLQQEPVADPVR